MLWIWETVWDALTPANGMRGKARVIMAVTKAGGIAMELGVRDRGEGHAILSNIIK